MKKGASELIGFMIVILISVVAVSATFFWAVKMIDNNRKLSSVQYAEDVMSEISDRISKVAREKGQDSIRIELKEGQVMQITNSTIIIFNTNAVEAEGLSGTKYVRGNYEMCNAANVSEGQENACVVQKFLSKVELYFVDSASDDSFYKIRFSVDGNGAAAKGFHTVSIKHGGIIEEGSNTTSIIKVGIQ